MLRLIAVPEFHMSPLLLFLVLVRAELAWTSLHGLKSLLPYSLVLGFIVPQIGLLFSVALLREGVFIS